MPGRSFFVPTTRAGVVVVLAAASVPAAQAAALQSARTTGPGSSVIIERYDPRLDALIPADARVETILDGHEWVEGPAWSATEQAFYFSDIPRNAVYRWTEREGEQLFLRPAGYTGTAPFTGREPGSNGLLFDAQGRLVLNEHGDRRITRLEKDGTKTVLADRYLGRRLNSPNDAAFGPNGDLYFTDPPFGLPQAFDDPQRELTWQGVYRVKPDGDVELLTRDVRAPNGIAFSPDGRTLYISNADRAHAVYLAFDVAPDGSIGNRRTFFDVTREAGELAGGPDGMKTDARGNLFAAGPGGVYVLAPDGTLLGRILLGRATSNVAWGGDGSDLWITAGTAILRLRTATRAATS